MMILSVMTLSSILLTVAAVAAENQPNAAFTGLATPGPNMEGKEVRFGATASALWGTLTTQTSNGSVNSMHDSFAPLGGMIPLIGMLINETYGGVGVGMINFFLFLVITVFIAGLMVGRTPELFGRKLEAKEIKLAAIALLVQPLLILVPTAITLALPRMTGNSNPGFHGITQTLYEYTSAFANNGSGFEGLGDNTVWWNVTTSINLILGRFIPIIAPLAVAGYLAKKRVAPENAGTLKVSTPIFAVTTFSVIILLTLLNFLPVLVLGPLSEQLVSVPEIATSLTETATSSSMPSQPNLGSSTFNVQSSGDFR
jgi:K+-transporting ATPase ATPase A chain